jgi:hypothetical protein
MISALELVIPLEVLNLRSSEKVPFEGADEGLVPRIDGDLSELRTSDP